MTTRSRLLPACLLLFAGCTNFHVVQRGQVYRSQQPQEHELARWIDQYDLRTVLCLRGGPAASKSRRSADAADIDYVQVTMSAEHRPKPETLLKLWDVFANAQRPLLIHCRAGADRTSLASALCVLHDTGDLARARAELALIPYGHLAIMGREQLDQVLDRYAPFHGTLSFPDWVRQHYAADFARQ